MQTLFSLIGGWSGSGYFFVSNFRAGCRYAFDSVYCSVKLVPVTAVTHAMCNIRRALDAQGHGDAYV
jgi:hypothetical protein